MGRPLLQEGGGGLSLPLLPLKPRQRVLHLPVQQEILPAGDHAGNAVVGQTLLQQGRLPPGAVEHRDVLEAPHAPGGPQHLGLQHADAAHHPGDLLGHEDGLRPVPLGGEQAYLRPVGAVGLHAPGRAVDGLRHRQGRGENLRGGAVILRQPHRPLRPQGGEAAGVRPAEAVDGLVGIADGEKGATLPPPGPEKPELEAVDVLELVYQQVGKAPVRPAALPLAQGLQQEVVKVQLSLQLLLIEGKGRVVPAVRSGLVPGDRPEEGPGAPLPAQLRQGGGRRRPLLIGAGQGHVPQQLQADGVEGADGHGAGRPPAQTPLQPRPQLPCRPVGEGHGGELRGLGPPLLHQPGHPLHQGVGLARAGSGEHRHRGLLRRGGGALGPVQSPGGGRPLLPAPCGFRHPAPGGLGRLGGLHPEEAHLPLEVLPLGGAEQLDHTVGPVVPRAAHHLASPQPADALRHAGPGRGPDVLQRHLPENGELRPQSRQHGLVLGAHLLACGRAPLRGGDHLRQRHQALKGPGIRADIALRPVRQLLHPVEHAGGQPLAAHRTHPSGGLRLHRGEAHPTVPVAVKVVLALLGEKLNGTVKALPGLDGPGQLRVGQARVQQVGLPPQFGRRVGIGVGHQGISVQGGTAADHCGIRGEPGLQGVDMAGEIAEALPDGVKAGEGPKQGEVGRPDVSGDEHRIRAGLQGDLQQIPAVQAQDGPPVGVEVANGLQAAGEGLRRLQMGQENQGVNLAHLAVFLVDGADLPGDYEPGRVRPGSLQGIESLLRLGQLVPQLGPPGGVGEVAGAYQADALPSGPGIQRLRLQLLAGGPGVFGVDMQIGDIHAASSPSRFFPILPPFPHGRKRKDMLHWSGQEGLL